MSYHTLRLIVEYALLALLGLPLVLFIALGLIDMVKPVFKSIKKIK